MAMQLTIRGVPEEIGERLKTLSRERSQSVNRTVLGILQSAVGFEERRERLQQYVTWTQQDREDFEATLAAQRTIDDADWG